MSAVPVQVAPVAVAAAAAAVPANATAPAQEPTPFRPPVFYPRKAALLAALPPGPPHICQRLALSQDVFAGAGTKRFASFPSAAHLANYLRGTAHLTPSNYEIVWGPHSLVHPYFDLDRDVAEDDMHEPGAGGAQAELAAAEAAVAAEAAQAVVAVSAEPHQAAQAAKMAAHLSLVKNELLSRFLEKLGHVLREQYGMQPEVVQRLLVPGRSVQVATTHNRHKISLHVKLHRVHCSQQEAKALAARLAAYISSTSSSSKEEWDHWWRDSRGSCIVDQSVYSSFRSFRTLGSTKLGVGLPLVPFAGSSSAMAKSAAASMDSNPSNSD
ncbi:hypothetical protein V8C86DRAFT_2446952 [Haematococcus lacustris]